MSNLDREFLLLEYKSLRQEISESLKDVPGNERNAILVSGAFWVWFLSDGISEVYYYGAVFIPLALSCAFLLRAKAIAAKFASLRDYISKLESKLELDGLGWETFLLNSPPNWFKEQSILFWRLLILGNFIIALTLISLKLHKSFCTS